ncbi:cytosolic sulfotransferase 5-like [Trifolium pratense]|uniref:cytosolic sulfotransferase 5-like n=1 Tax=Trifolium pratense TaxID=57577 RepID=UPI001E694715|nr:cytosolic sulfotransferase 5-like [Trifolium pratense]
MEKLTEENSLEAKDLENDSIGQECKELISTLPLEKSWIFNQCHQYQGFWIVTKNLQGLLSCQKHFQTLDTDILLATAPKSGTTWLKALTFALLNRHKYHSKNHPLLTSNPHSLVPYLEHLYLDKDVVPNLNSLSPPRLFSTHVPYESVPKSMKESTCKVVYLSRDPKDMFVSLWHFTNKIRAQQSRGTVPLEEVFESFCKGVSPFGPFWEHVLGYWKESLERPEKVMFIKFEEIKIKPTFYLKMIAEFLGFPFSNDEESKGVVDDILNLCSFEMLSNLEVNKTGTSVPITGIENKAFFRRGEVGDWKNHLTPEMSERLNTIIKQKLGKYGLSF